jgi:hypothetical protein
MEGWLAKTGIAIFVAEGLGFGVEPAGVDGCLKAPRVEGQGEVVADPGDVVLGGGLEDEGVGAGAVGALEVFKFDDGDAGSGGGRRAAGSWTWVPGGGANWARDMEDAAEARTSAEKDEQVANVERAKDGGHFDWTAP